jgi:hypothetical protein
VLLVLKDVQWADRSTLELVAFRARRMRGERIVVAATYRLDEVERRMDLRRFPADVGRAATAPRLTLAG